MAPTIGFVVATILDSNGNCMVKYTYNAWGKSLEISDYSENNLGTINPLRYRGYYYDRETGLYYLQSRYYDPTVGRFINADDYSFLGATGTASSHNLFAYCENNPVSYSDNSGFFSIQRWIVADVLDFALDWFFPFLNPINKLANQFTGRLFKQKAFNPIKKAIRKLADGSFKLLNSIKNIVRKIPFVGKRLAKKINPEKFRRQIIGYIEGKVFNAFLDSLISNISELTSIGGWVSIALDYFTDGSLNKKIRLW